MRGHRTTETSQRRRRGHRTRHVVSRIVVALVAIGGVSASLGGATLWHQRNNDADRARLLSKIAEVRGGAQHDLDLLDRAAQAAASAAGLEVAGSSAIGRLTMARLAPSAAPAALAAAVVAHGLAPEAVEARLRLDLVRESGSGSGRATDGSVDVVIDSDLVDLIGHTTALAPELAVAVTKSLTDSHPRLGGIITAGDASQPGLTVQRAVAFVVPTSSTAAVALLFDADSIVSLTRLHAAGSLSSEMYFGIDVFAANRLNAVALPASVRLPTDIVLTDDLTGQPILLRLWALIPDGNRRFDGAPLLLAIAGSFGSVLLAAVVAALVLNRERVRKLVSNAVGEMQASEARLLALHRHAADVAIVATPDGITTFVSQAALHVLGVDPDASLGLPVAELFGVSADVVSDAFRAVLRSPRGSVDTVEAVSDPGVRADGIVEIILTNLVADDAVRGVVVNVADITERRKVEAMLAHQAAHDALTGLPNRGQLDKLLTTAHRGIAGTDDFVAVLFIDLDGFKAVNDTHGHQAGDRLLIQIADRLRSVLRGSDHAIRYGGDEFVIIGRLSDRAEVTGLRERLRTVVAQPVEVAAGVTATVGASVGYVVCDATEVDLRATVKQADELMYAEKMERKKSERALTPRR